MTVPGIKGRKDLYQGALTVIPWFQHLVNLGKVYRYTGSGHTVSVPEEGTDPFSVAFKTPNSTIRVWCGFTVHCGCGMIVDFHEGSTLVPDTAAYAKNRVIGGTSATLFMTDTAHTAPGGTKLWSWLAKPVDDANYDGHSIPHESNVFCCSNLLLKANETYAISVYSTAADSTTVSGTVTVEIAEEVARES